MQGIFTPCWLGIGRGGDQDRISAGIPRSLGKTDCVLCPDCARADNHRQAVIDDINAEGHQPDAFLGTLGIIFTGCAGNDDAVNTIGNQLFDHAGIGGLINAEIIIERGDDRGVDAVEFHGVVSRPVYSAIRVSASVSGFGWMNSSLWFFDNCQCSMVISTALSAALAARASIRRS